MSVSLFFMQNWEHLQEVTKQEVTSSHETKNIIFTNEVAKEKEIMNFTFLLENIYQKYLKLIFET